MWLSRVISGFQPSLKASGGALHENLSLKYSVACPYFGHPAQTSFTKYKFFMKNEEKKKEKKIENSFATIVNGRTVLKLF